MAHENEMDWGVFEDRMWQQTDCIFADLQWWHDQLRPMRETLWELFPGRGASADSALDRWERIIQTREHLRRGGRGLRWRDLEPGLHDRSPLPPYVDLAALPEQKRCDMLEATHAAIRDCRGLLLALTCRDGSGYGDYWLGEDAPSARVTAYLAWFRAALLILGPVRWRRAA